MKDFGKGWMTANAQDLCKIVCVFGNVDPKELIRELEPAIRRAELRGGSLLNTASIESAIERLRTKC